MNTKELEKPPMGKVLFIAPLPCIRLWKEAKALKKFGYEIYLGEAADMLGGYFKLSTDIFEERFNLSSLAAFGMIRDYFDIIHCHNEPDTLTGLILTATKNSPISVIHDCHDFVSSKARNAMSDSDMIVERMVNVYADRAIYVSKRQKRHVAGLMRENHVPSIILYNAPLEEHIPKELPEKKPNKKKPKIVYAGTVREVQDSHRFFIPQFVEIMKAGFELYCYAPDMPPLYDQQLRGFREWNNMGHCPQEKLIGELAKYDMGILPFVASRENYVHLSMGMPNKLFEYISAGLPVVSRVGLEDSNDFIKENKLGIVYREIQDIKDNLDTLFDITPPRFEWTMDKEVEEKLLPIYTELIMANTYKKIAPERKVKINEIKGNVCVIKTWEDGKEFEYTEKDEEGKETKKKYVSHLYGRKDHVNDLLFEAFVKEEEGADRLPVMIKATKDEEEAIKERIQRMKKQLEKDREKRKAQIKKSIKSGGGGIPVDEKDIYVSLALIIKDEEKTVENTITSLYNICDEMVVIDTGSTDKTISIIKKYPKVILFTRTYEPMDFSAARNFVQSKCRGRWIVVIDGDEEFMADQLLVRRRLLSEQKWMPFNLHTVQMGESGMPTSHLTQIRIYPNNKDFSWERREHNQLVFPEKKYRIHKTDWHNIHWGFADERKTKARNDRSDRYIALLKKEIKDTIDFGGPVEVEKTMNLTKFCCFRNREDECLEYAEVGYKQFSDEGPEEQRRLSRFLISYANACVITGHYDRGDKLLDHYHRLMGEVVDSTFLKHTIAYWRGNLIAACVWGTKYLELMQIEPRKKLFNYQIFAIFSTECTRKVRWLRYAIAERLEI